MMEGFCVARVVAMAIRSAGMMSVAGTGARATNTPAPPLGVSTIEAKALATIGSEMTAMETSTCAVAWSSRLSTPRESTEAVFNDFRMALSSRLQAGGPETAQRTRRRGVRAEETALPARSALRLVVGRRCLLRALLTETSSS